MKSILGMGNALTDILAVLPDDSFLRRFHLPKGSMQHVDMETGDKIWQTLKPMGVQYVAGGSAANTITGTAIFGMEYSDTCSKAIRNNTESGLPCLRG